MHLHGAMTVGDRKYRCVCLLRYGDPMISKRRNSLSGKKENGLKLRLGQDQSTSCHHHHKNYRRRGESILNQDTPNQHEFEISGSSGIYHLSWPELHLDVRVDRIKESSDHEVKGEVQFTSSRPTSAGHLRSGRLNLTSPAARNTFGKALSSRDSEVDWDRVMEQLCTAVLDKWRHGSPVVVLDGKVDVTAQAKWLIDPIVQLHNPTLIYGPGSTGKSWFAQYLAVLADHGMNHGGVSVEPLNGRVLYLDWETDQQEIGARVTMIRKGLALDGESRILYKSMNQGLANDIESIRSIVAEHSISLVVIDSLGSACMGEPESAEVVLRAFGALRSLNVSSLIIDHTNKEKILFGSVYKFNSARMVFLCVKDQQEDQNKIVFGLLHKKANNFKLMRPIGFELGFGDGFVTITRRDVRDTPLEEHMNMKDRIENLLKNTPGGMSVTDIAEMLDKNESHVRKELSEGKNNGRFVILGNKQWANRAWEEEESWRI